MSVEVQIGSMVAGYRIERKLGTGAMGTVYLARDEHLQRLVAVKLLTVELAGDKRFRERFLRESRVAARLEHPRIVPIYAAGEVDGNLYLAMRYVDGPDLRDVIKREGPLAPDRALSIVGQIAEALDAAHEAGLVHRDVKPGNILLEGGNAFLCDFGLAKHRSTVNSLTRDSAFVGTIDYISPEQIQGATVDGRADQYALGCVLYEALTGRPPFSRETELSVVFAHLKEPPPLPTAARPGLPDGIDAVVARALAKHPSQRYSSCADLVADAATGLAGGEVDAPPPRTVTHAFLIADLRGYTRYTQQHGDEAAALLSERFIRLATAQVDGHDGRVMATHGDEIVAVFESPRHAVRAALAIQAAAAEDGLPLGVGIGLDAGEAVEVGDDYRGGALNMAARLCSAGRAGEVLASEPLTHLARAIEGVTYLEGRVERLKGIPQPVRVIEVVPAGRGDAVLRRLRRRARGRRLGRVAVPLAAAAAVLAAILVVRGGSGETALADVTRPHTIALFDTGTGKYLKTISTNQDQPEQLIEDRLVWSLDRGVAVGIDPAKHTIVKRVPVGDANDFTASGGSLWLSKSDAPVVLRLDPVYGTVTRRYQLPTDDLQDWNTAPDDVVYAAGSLWVAHGFQVVRRINPRTGKVVHTFPLFGAKEIAAGDGAVFVVSASDGLLKRIDPATNQIEWTTKLHPWIDEVAIAGGYAWMTTNSDPTLFKFDLGNGRLLKPIPTGSADSRIAAGDGALWVENSWGGTVTRVDLATDRTRTFPVGHAPAGIVAIGRQLWVGLAPSPEDELAGVTGNVARISLREDWLDGQSDPATTWGSIGQQLEYATQAKLYNYPDRAGSAGGVPVPEVAAGMPEESNDGRTVTIRVRPGFRFSPPSNTPVTAETLRYSIERAFAPGVTNGLLFLPQLVGAADFESGKAAHISGLTASGDTLTMRFTQPVADLPEILAAPFFSAVPEGTPLEQIDDPIPSAGPYYIVNHGWYVIVKRNPNYHGSRPHSLDAIVYRINLDTAAAAARVIDGRMDVVIDPEGETLQPTGDLARRYANATAGHPRYLRYAIRGTKFFTLNNSRGPLRDVSVRRAINYAIDRQALSQVDGNFPTDHYLPAGMPGAQLDRHIYPIDGPQVATARKLMHGRRLTLALWTCNHDDCAERARILRHDLEAIGISLRVKAFSDQYAHGRAYDIRDDGWYVDKFDPSNMLGVPMFGMPGYLEDPTFVDPLWQARVDRIGRLTTGQGRFAAFGRLELAMMRDASPWAAFGQQIDRVFLSARAGCTVVNPVYGFDLAAMCVKDS
jgi:class 3 adenylate cyclase/ABC-type transport system substrate-binding protein/streptogramin lyase